MTIKRVALICFFTLTIHSIWGQTESKCFSNGGLKYRTTVTLIINTDNTISGTVVSDEYDDIPVEQSSFTGIKTRDKLKVKFSGTPPIVGVASRWTNKAWTIKKTDGIDMLIITFYAKNYDTNKWSNTNYEFAPCDE
ncbi:MAG: hypothetical protein HGA42_15765 [Nostocales cyanobacterium W4_Combined_metabat2_030]|nr:hypothetical protein [Nostocales cyanobacterium W4_Combined_metabat2_030]